MSGMLNKKISDMTAEEFFRAKNEYEHRKCPICNYPIPSDKEYCTAHQKETP